MIALVIALEEETKGIEHPCIYISGVGKVNSAIATFKAIKDGATTIINYGSAGLVNKKRIGLVDNLITPNAIVQRDMSAEPLAPRGITPFEQGTLAGALYLNIGTDIILGSGDSFVKDNDEWFDYAEVDIVDMEAYSIYKVCKHFDINFECYKWISDFADEDASKEWSKNVSNGNTAFNKVLSARSSAGQSNGLLSRGSGVRISPGRPTCRTLWDYDVFGHGG